MNHTWTFGQKLGLGFGVVILLTIVIAVVAAWSTRSVSLAKDQVIRAALDDLGDAGELRLLAEQRSSSARGFLLTAEQTFRERSRQLSGRCETLLDDLRRRSSEADRPLLDRVGAALDAHGKALDEAFAARTRTGVDLAALGRDFNEEITPRNEEVRRSIDAWLDRRRADLEQERVAASDAASLAQGLVTGTAIVSALLGIAVALVLGRALARQVGQAIQHMQSSTAELQAASSQQVSATREQATAMNEIATTIRELLATSRQIAEGAQRVARIAEETADGARSGGTVVQRAHEAIAESKRHMELVVEKMLDLGRRSQQIGGVLELVSELLEQTNILAVNATIEAAGAGEGGRRFGAVADEIRKLSDRVGSTAKEVRALVEEVRASVNGTIMATEGSSKATDAGTRQFGEVASAFQAILARVSTTTEAAREIELSTKQQASAVEQVNTAIANVSQSTRETESSTAQTLQTATELANLSRELSRLVRADA